jgi:hypothetical protein
MSTESVDDGVADAGTIDEIEALRRELLRTRRDNAQFQLKVKNLSQKLEGVTGQRHEADLSAIRSHIVENRALGPLVYEGVRVSVSSEPAATAGVSNATAASEGSAPTSTTADHAQNPDAPPLPRAQTRSRAVRVAQSLTAQAPFVMNSIAALDVSSRLASTQGVGRRAGAASVSQAGQRSATVQSQRPSSQSWAEVYRVDVNEGLPTPPRASPPGVPRSQSNKGKARVRAHDWEPDSGRENPPGAQQSSESEASQALPRDAHETEPRADIDTSFVDTPAAPLPTSLGSEGDLDDDDDEAPPPPPLGSPSSAVSPTLPPVAAPPVPSLRSSILLSPPPAVRRHSSVTLSPTRRGLSTSETDVSR